MNDKKIFKVKTQADVPIDADYDSYALDLSSAVNKGYLKLNCLTKDTEGNNFDANQSVIHNTEPYYDGLYQKTSLVSKEYVDLMDTNLEQKIQNKAVLSTNNEQTFNSIINVPNFDQGYSNMNKEYIDSRDALKADKSYADNTFLTKNTGAILTNTLQSKASKIYVDSTFLTRTQGNVLANSLHTKLDINGSSSMQSNLKMGGYNITDLKQPTNDTDAANKKFVVDLVNQDKIKQTFIRKNVFSFTLNRSLWKTEFKTRNLSLIEKDFKIHHINLHLVSFEINREVKPGTSINVGNKTDKNFSEYNKYLIHINKNSDHGVLYIDIDFDKKHDVPTDFNNEWVPCYLIFYGVIGYVENVDSSVYDSFMYFENDNIYFEKIVNMNDKQIINVEAGTTDKSVVNLLQLQNKIKLLQKKSYYEEIF